MIAFTLPEDPFGWQRAGSSGHHYTKKETREYEGRVTAACKEVMRRRGLKMFIVPVVVSIDFRLFPPASFSQKKRAAMLAGEIGITGRYDIDNLTKAILDALNKVAFKDDRLIVGAQLWKVASETPGVDVLVEAYGGRRGQSYEVGPSVRSRAYPGPPQEPAGGQGGEAV